MVENPAPKKQDVTILTASAATVDTAKQENESKTLEPPPIGPEKNLSLLDLGYCPYVIKRDDGESLLFTGAFYHKADAEKEHIELALKGIQTRLVKR